jgi:hypothetical protein
MDFLKIINISYYWLYFSNTLWVSYWELFGEEITRDIYDILMRHFSDLVEN